MFCFGTSTYNIYADEVLSSTFENTLRICKRDEKNVIEMKIKGTERIRAEGKEEGSETMVTFYK